MNTDERALEAITLACIGTDFSKATVPEFAQAVLAEIKAAGIELFEAAPANEESQ